MGNGRRRRRWAFRTGEERRAGRINWFGDRKEWRDTKHGFFLQQHTVQTGCVQCGGEILISKMQFSAWNTLFGRFFFKKNKQESLPCLSMLVASLVGGVLATFFPLSSSSSSSFLLSPPIWSPRGKASKQPTQQAKKAEGGRGNFLGIRPTN